MCQPTTPLIEKFDVNSLIDKVHHKIVHSNGLISTEEVNRVNAILGSGEMTVNVSNNKNIFGESRSCVAINKHFIEMTYEAFYNSDNSPKSDLEIQAALTKAIFQIARMNNPHLDYNEAIAIELYQNKNTTPENVVITE